MKHAIVDLTPQSLYAVETSKLFLRAGGLSSTCHFPAEESGDQPWLVLGSGIRLTENGGVFLSSSDWASVIQQKTPALSAINGGFVLLRAIDGGVELFCDNIGFRTLYLAKTERGILFSTRLDWIARVLPSSSIDLASFGARWLIFNQLSYESPLKNVIRLGPAGHALLTPRSIEHTHTPWTPHPVHGTTGEVSSLASKFLNAKGKEPHEVKIGLSGGVDSRVLLSIALSEKIPFSTYTFGADDEPDVAVARHIAQREGFHHTVYYSPMPPVGKCIALIDDYVGQANLNETLPTLLRLRNIAFLKPETSLLIDGAYGEVARRQYFNRIAVKGKKFLRDKNVDALIPFFRVHRADIFTDEVYTPMNTSIRQQIADLLDSMPPIDEIGTESYLDLMAVRARIPNFGADEQARLDSIVLNLMPLGTLAFINAAFSLPLSDRRDGKLFRRLIRQKHPSLARYPFVKFGTTYPFWMTSVQSWAWARMKDMGGLAYKDNSLHEFLHHIREYILDTVNSSTVRNYHLYDYNKVLKLTRDYFEGNRRLGQEVNWWFTFDMWRRKVEK